MYNHWLEIAQITFQGSGIGIKTAAELINKYKTLENLLKKASEIPQNKRRETLISNKDKALISKKLLTLKNDVR